MLRTGDESNYDVLVLDLLDSFLEGWSHCCDRRSSLKNVLLANQLIAGHGYMHTKSHVYAT